MAGAITHALGMDELRRQVLIVDGNDAVRESLRHAFALIDYRVLTAASSSQAREHLATQHADLFLLDLDTDTENDGMTLACQLVGQHPGKPIIGMTTDAARGTHAIGAPLTALIEKPLDMPALINQVTRLVDNPQPISPTLL